MNEIRKIKSGEKKRGVQVFYALPFTASREPLLVNRTSLNAFTRTLYPGPRSRYFWHWAPGTFSYLPSNTIIHATNTSAEPNPISEPAIRG